MKQVQNKLRVLHFPQVPCEPFEVEVSNEVEAKKIMDVLAQQHLWLFKNNIIPDYSNIMALEMLVDGEWEDYYNEDEEMEWEEFEEIYLTEAEVGN